jgi:Flp pilus assembly protein TadD
MSVARLFARLISLDIVSSLVGTPATGRAGAALKALRADCHRVFERWWEDRVRRREGLVMSQGREGRLKLFISYSRRDQDVADRMVSLLEERGFEVLIDRRDLPYGEEWQKELAAFIRAADTVIWLVSPDSIASKWCGWEAGEVGRIDKRLVPVCIRDIDRGTLPETLGKIHLLPGQGVFSPDVDMETLVSVLLTDRAWIKDATRLYDRAQQWLAKERDGALLLRGTALRDAEGWQARRPETAPPVPADTLALIMASRRSAVRRQRYWLAGGIAALAVVAQIALITIFYNLDSIINQARVLLRSAKVEEAQQQVAQIAANPMYRLVPESASAGTLASEMLDLASVEYIYAETQAAGTASGDRDNVDVGSVVAQNGRATGLINRSDGSSVLLDCLPDRACAATVLPASWAYSALASDGVEPFVVAGADLQGVRKIGHVDHAATLSVATLAPKAALSPSFRAKLAPGPAFDAEADKDMGSYGAPRCSSSRRICIVTFTDIALDARGRRRVFEIWGFLPGSDPGRSPKWVRLLPRFYEPLVSRNAVAVSESGDILVITNDRTVSVWRTSQITATNRRPWKSFQLNDLVLDAVFEPGTDKLVLLTDHGLARLDIEPRSRATAAQAPTLSVGDAGGTPKAAYWLDGRRAILRHGETLELFDGATDRLTPLLTAEADTTLTVRVWRVAKGEMPVVSVAQSQGLQPKTSFYRLSSDGALAKIAELPGQVVPALDDRVAAVSDLSVGPNFIMGCAVRLYRVSDMTKIDDTLRLGGCVSLEKVIAVSEARAAVVVRSHDSSSRARDVFSVMSLEIDAHGRARVTGVTKLELTASALSERGFHYLSPQGDLVSLVASSGALAERRRIWSDAGVKRLLAAAQKPDKPLQMVANDAGAFVFFLGNAGCPQAGQEEQRYGSNILLAHGTDTVATPHMLLRCIPAFPVDITGVDSEVALSAGGPDTPVFLGALAFPGVFRWTLEDRSVRLFVFPSLPAPGFAAGIREYGMAVHDSGLVSGLKEASLSDLRLDVAAPVMTAAQYRAAPKLLAFFGEGRSGNPRGLQVLDFATMTLRALENQLSFQLDQVSALEMSPNGRFVLSLREGGACELFRTSDGIAFTLPPQAREAHFVSDTEIDVMLADGGRLRWAVPEGEDRAFSKLARAIVAHAVSPTYSVPPAAAGEFSTFQNDLDMKKSAEAHVGRQEYGAAIADYTNAIEYNPLDFDLHSARGAAYLNAHDYAAAQRDFNDAFDIASATPNLDSQAITMLTYRAIAEQLAGTYDAAIADYSEVLRWAPDNMGALWSRGAAYYQKRDYDRALSDLNRAIAAKPDAASPLRWRGLVFAALGQKDKAIADFEAALKLPDAKTVYGSVHSLVQEALRGLK